MSNNKRNRGRNRKPQQKQNQGNNNQSTRVTAKDLVVGDRIKLGVPVKITSIEAETSSLHDELNRGQKVMKIVVTPTAGPYIGKSVAFMSTETDRIDMLSFNMYRRSFWKRLKLWFKDRFSSNNNSNNNEN